jgi:hypothetical protein
MTIIAARASITAMRVQKRKTAMFCQPAQEPWVVCLLQQQQQLSPSAWPTRAAQAPQQRRLRQQYAQQQEEFSQVRGQGLQALPPTWHAPQSHVGQVPC